MERMEASHAKARGLTNKNKDPSWVLPRWGLVHTHTGRAPGGFGSLRRPAFVDFEPGRFRNLYQIAHSESTVEKWDNFHTSDLPTPSHVSLVCVRHHIPVLHGWVKPRTQELETPIITKRTTVIAKVELVVTPIPPLTLDLPFVTQPISLFHRIWPVAGLIVAIIVNLAWMSFLGYGLFKLVKPEFF